MTTEQSEEYFFHQPRKKMVIMKHCMASRFWFGCLQYIYNLLDFHFLFYDNFPCINNKTRQKKTE